MKEKRSFIKKLGWFLSIFFLLFLVPYFILTIILTYGKITNFNNLPGVFGYKPVIIKNNEMKDDLFKGDLLIIKTQESYNSLSRGDIITFKKDNEHYETKMIYSIEHQSEATSTENPESDPSEYKTKSSSKQKADTGSILSTKIEGIYFLRIPLIGQYISYIENGWLLVISIPILIILIILFIIIATKCEAKKIPVKKEEKELEMMSAAELTTGKQIREELEKKYQKNKTPAVAQSQNIISQQPASVTPPVQNQGQISNGIYIVPPTADGQKNTVSQQVQTVQQQVVQSNPVQTSQVVVQPQPQTQPSTQQVVGQTPPTVTPYTTTNIPIQNVVPQQPNSNQINNNQNINQQ